MTLSSVSGQPLPAEPSLDRLRNPALRYLLATRPAFLGVSLCAALIGLASAAVDGVAMDGRAALVTVLFALVAHAGVNVLNDYYDELGGTDRINTERVFPFTGGSRFIQNGVMGVGETLVFGLALFALVAASGLWLTARSGPGLIAVGLAGLFVGWGYSAPPLRFNSRGLGEPCVVLGFALIAAGADFVERRSFAVRPWLAVLPFALLTLNILYINQFPDLRADRAAGKHHWVVRLGAHGARWGGVAIAALAYGLLIAEVIVRALPVLALLGLVALPWSLRGARGLLQHARQPAQLRPAIQATIAAAMLHGMLLAAALLVAALGWA